MTARKNVAFGIRQVNKEASRTERLKIADEFLEKVGLEGFKNKYPSQLSGGMQQRVAIARALAMDTDILLMDEPFGAIDAKNRTILQELLLELWEGDGTSARKTVVFVTHDIDEAILSRFPSIVRATAPSLFRRRSAISSEISCWRCSTATSSAKSAETRWCCNDIQKENPQIGSLTLYRTFAYPASA